MLRLPSILPLTSVALLACGAVASGQPPVAVAPQPVYHYPPPSVITYFPPTHPVPVMVTPSYSFYRPATAVYHPAPVSYYPGPAPVIRHYRGGLYDPPVSGTVTLYTPLYFRY